VLLDFDLIMACLKYNEFMVAFEIVELFLRYFELEMGIVIEY